MEDGSTVMSTVSAGLTVGVRVCRGPDWKWANQDDGEGHIGTVVEIGRPGSRTSPDKTVVVQWDSGNKTNYRVGYQGAHDLRLFDNAPAGVRHPAIICDACNVQGISGIRWRCSRCSDFDLCTPCYNAGKHDLQHPFTRLVTPTSKGVKVSKRHGAVSVEAKGIFPGAKVERGPVWDWGNQDGGDGRVGKVIDIRGWDQETERSVANILWHSGNANVYRLGHKGKADLKYHTAASGGQYYRDHLPVLGEPTEQLNSSTPPCPFKVGNRVKVDMDADVLKVMQEGHGGWNPKMADYIGKVGTVHRITDRGDIRVQYEGCTNRWTFHPGALTKVQVYSVGDAVMVISDVEKVRDLQKGHGEWTEAMALAVGQLGKVVKVYSDGDMRVCVAGQTWTFNPQCCVPRPQDQQRIDNTKSSEESVAGSSKTSTAVTSNTGNSGTAVSQMTTMLDEIMLTEHEPATPASLVKEALQGHLEVVQAIIAKHPDQINAKSAGKTALQVAAHQGDSDIVLALLGANADLELRDEDGDSALHYSAFGNQAEVMKLLLENGANINAVNNGGCSTLHVAVNKQHLDCVKVLLEQECDVNIQDSLGDTAQHDAIAKDNKEIVALLLEHERVDFTLKNKRGFNLLQHAGLKGNAYAAEHILSHAADLVNSKKDDGFSSLHLAALNGHLSVAQVLLEKGGADIETKNNRGQTPLMLSVTQGQFNVVKLLVEKEADVNAVDEDGDSALHLALLRQSGTTSQTRNNALGSESGSPSKQVSSSTDDGTSLVSREIAMYLADHGAEVSVKDFKGRCALDLVSNDDQLKTHLEQYRTIEEPVDCIVCEEVEACVVFYPCRHKIVCAECCIKMKKCLTCQSAIEKKLSDDGSEAVAPNIPRMPRRGSDENMREMARRLQEMEDTLTCVICLDRKRSVAFLCGHSACQECAQPLRQCHMCRKPITKRINLFT